jgi:hypothetical protein
VPRFHSYNSVLFQKVWDEVEVEVKAAEVKAAEEVEENITRTNTVAEAVGVDAVAAIRKEIQHLAVLMEEVPMLICRGSCNGLTENPMVSTMIWTRHPIEVGSIVKRVTHCSWNEHSRTRLLPQRDVV